MRFIRDRKNDSIKLVLGLFTLLFLQIGCSKNNDGPQEGVLRVQTIGEPPTVDPSLTSDAISNEVLANISEGLTQYNENLDSIPCLAESWKVSKDKKTYTFKIRPNVKWTDGQPLVAQHFVDAWLRLLDPNTATETAYYLFDVEGAEAFNTSKGPKEKIAVKAPDASTLVVTLKGPAAYFPSMLTYPATHPIRMDVIQKFGDRWTDPKNIVTIGAYRLISWKHDESLTLKANETFFEGPPSIKEIHFRIVTENTTALTLFETGKVDIARAVIPPVDLPRFKGRPELKSFTQLRMLSFMFKVNKKPFNDLRVRKAFAMAVDKSLFNAVLKSDVIPTDSWIPKGMLGYDANLGLGFNPKQAKKLLAEAGFPEGKGFPKNTVLMFDSREEYKIIGEFLQSQWREHLGVSMNIQTPEWKVFLKTINTDEPDVFRNGWNPDYPDPDNMMALYRSNSSMNRSNWKSAEFDHLITLAAQASEPQVRTKFYTQAQKMLLERDVVIIPLFQETLNQLIGPRVKKSFVNPMNRLYFKRWSL